MDSKTMTKKILAITVSLFACFSLLFASCSSQGLTERKYQVKPQPQPVEQVITILEGYRDGKPVGSEVTNLPALIKDMREKSGDKMEIVQEAFDRLMKDSQNARQIATDVLKKLDAE